MVLIMLSSQYFASSETEASRKNYEEALKILENADPGTLKSSFENKGDLYMVLERTDEAYTAYNSAFYLINHQISC